MAKRPFDPDETTTGVLQQIAAEEGAPAVDVRTAVISVHVLALVPAEFARSRLVLPLKYRDHVLFVATVDPNALGLIDEIGFLTGQRVVAYAAPRGDLDIAIRDAYTAKSRGFPEWRGPLAPSPNTPGEAPSSLAAYPQATSAPPNWDPSLEQSSPLKLAYVDEALPSGPAIGPFDTPYPTAVQAPERSQRPRVLVVDDEKAIRGILRTALTQRGYDISEAGTGMEALRQVKDVDPDAILLDAMLPDVHGFEIARRLKESRRYAHIPIIMMTAVYKGWRIAADLRESYGVLQVIEKPFDIHAIAKVLETAIGGQQTSAPDAKTLSRDAKREYNEASAAYKRGDVVNAIAGMRRAASADPLSPHLRLQLGLLLAMQGDDFQAINELELAIELDPDLYQGLRNLASLYQRKGFRRKATELFERALNVAPDDAARTDLQQLLVKLLAPVVKPK